MRAAFDVVIAGAGPAGAVAALVLSRAGVRVALFDRARFPRHKLCGDTVNPGALALLRRLGLEDAAGSMSIDGMIVTGEGGVRIVARYPSATSGRAVLRRDLDHALLLAAAAAGARIEQEVAVRGPTFTSRAVNGLQIASRAGTVDLVTARLVIAADGRASRIARCLRLSRYPTTPRRWAVGAYFSGVSGLTEYGEMHIRRRKYIGVAPLPGGLANVCVVTPERSAAGRPLSLLQATVATEPVLRERFAHAQLTGPPTVLGPLAVECSRAGAPGVLLAGDAGGFIDPMTGDGLRFAIRGAELAAAEALRVLEHGATDAHARLQDARRREFGAKWRFNRALRCLVGSPAAVRLAAAAAARVPSTVGRSILYAGDVGVLPPPEERRPG